ncbi:hypothetical protein NPIL_444811 [Nephila pilipes]|uniref:Uncharacterized protein n=1 Tax=Nephila pilipes TaxID=299642 RepID=A0A8X6UAB1_NEPPI|nr:hypothetical protein NPIL_444811 [Nephila pilipes]
MLERITLAGGIELPQQQVSTFFYMDTLISVTNCHDLISEIDRCYFPTVQDRINKIINEHGTLPIQNPATILEENLKKPIMKIKKLPDEHYHTANLLKTDLYYLKLKREKNFK